MLNLVWSPQLLPVAVLVYACATATWSDIRSRLVPNSVCYGALLFGILYYSVSTVVRRLGLADLPTAIFVDSLPHALAGAFLCGLSIYPFWNSGEIGGGDLKFAAVIGMFLGPVAGLTVICIGAILALLFLATRRAMFILHRRWQVNDVPDVKTHVKHEPYELPMVCFFSMAAVLVVLQTLSTR